MSDPSFSFQTAGRILFGRGVAARAAALTLAYGTRVLMVRGRSVARADHLVQDLRAEGATVEQVISTGEPTLPALENAIAKGRALHADVVVAIGGGAVIDLGKATAALVPGTLPAIDHLEGVGGAQPLGADPLPFVAVPTTSGTGAEVTRNAVITVPEAARKVSLRDPRMLPDVALVDPGLTDHMPRAQTLASGLDALTQVVEPYLCARANPLTDALCRDAVPRGAAALARLTHEECAQARDDMSFISLAGGLALANAGLGAVHGLAGVLGGRLGAPHGLICGRLLGPVMIANRAVLAADHVDLHRFDEVAAWVAASFDRPQSDIFETWPALLDAWQLPRLSQWAASGVSLDEIAREAAGASSMRANPCVLPHDALVGILQQAI